MQSSNVPHAHNSVEHLQAGDAREKERLLTALSHASTPDTISEALNFALSPAVRSQDLSLISAVAARGGQSLQLAWEFLTRCARCTG